MKVIKVRRLHRPAAYLSEGELAPQGLVCLAKLWLHENIGH